MDILLNLIYNSLNGERYPVNFTDTLILVAFFLIFWVFLYELFCYIDPNSKCEWHCRMVTLIHASTVCLLGLWNIFIEWRMPFYRKNHALPNTSFEQFIFILCLGYFLFDLGWSLYYQTEGLVMLFHHSVSILGLSVCLFCGKWGVELTATIVGSELTNPLLQIRWFLRESGRKDSVLAEVIDAVFMILFGFLRIGIGSILLYLYLSNPRTDFLGKFAALTIYSIGWIFWFNIFNYACYQMRKKGFGKPLRPFADGYSPVVEETGDNSDQQQIRGSFDKQL